MLCLWIIVVPILLLTFLVLMGNIFEWLNVFPFIGIKKIDNALDPLLKVSAGLLAAAGVYLTHKRLVQIVEQTKNQTKEIKIRERGQVSERIKTGLELLSNEKEEIQISAVTFFDKLARDAEKTKDRSTVEEVFNMLCNYVRSITVKESYVKDNQEKPSPVVEAIINTLFWEGMGPETYQGCKANLTQAYLGGASLSEAYLGGADLSGAHLEGADLSVAYLEEADLSGAHLEGADLRKANLEGAFFGEANLERADLIRANLERADLIRANLKGAILFGAHLEGTFLNMASLKGAKFEKAHLEGAIFGKVEVTTRENPLFLDPTDVEGADFREALNWEKAHFTGVKNLDKKLLPKDFNLNNPPNNRPTNAQLEKLFGGLLLRLAKHKERRKCHQVGKKASK